MRAVGDDQYEEDYDITKLAVPELKMICRAHGLAVGGRKKDLISRLAPYLEGASALMNDDEDINERDDAVVDA